MTSKLATNWIPAAVNTGPWLVNYTLPEIERRIETQRVVLPICSLGTPDDELARLAPLVLPPLYHEALDADLKGRLIARIRECFPYFTGTRKRAERRWQFDVVELPTAPRTWPHAPPQVLAFSVDTAVEQHGPHLPLATDRFQSYAVLHQLALDDPRLVVGPPLDYGHLTWGLPLGMSIDIPPQVLVVYVSRFAAALRRYSRAAAVYVVDVHGSPEHRRAIQAGLERLDVPWRFRWLYEPLVEFAAERGDQHAGGVETAMIEAIRPTLVDRRWWPARKDDLAGGQMSFELALELTPEVNRFIEYAQTRVWNGIVGRIDNYFDVDGPKMLRRCVDLARRDLTDVRAMV